MPMDAGDKFATRHANVWQQISHMHTPQGTAIDNPTAHSASYRPLIELPHLQHAAIAQATAALRGTPMDK